jgi:anti-sigma factor RsiW
MTPHMSCKELVELVTEYDEGTLPAADRARFDAHLGLCPPCVEYLAQMRRTIEAVGFAAPELERTPAMTELLHLFRDWKRGAATMSSPT